MFNVANLIDRIDLRAIKLSDQYEADSQMIGKADEWEHGLPGGDHKHILST